MTLVPHPRLVCSHPPVRIGVHPCSSVVRHPALDRTSSEEIVPELPEVEIVARQLRARLVGRRFTDAAIRQPKAINLPVDAFREGIRQTIHAVDRRGKAVVLTLDTADLWLHRGLSGVILLDPPGAPAPAKDSMLAFDLDDGSRLRFEKLFMGHAHLLDREASAARAAEQGIDALDPRCSTAYFRDVAREKPKLTAKSFLMDQALVSGIGNSYSDEILHEAGLRPDRKLDDFTTAELDALKRAVVTVLEEAIAKGGDESYPDVDGHPGAFRTRVHNQTLCGSCGRATERLKGGQRGYYCPACQK
jgi:formamidopyrimidine-DNA glycosylase